MDLYYAMTNYHLLSCILHRILFNQETDAKILLSSFLTYHNPDLLKDLKASDIFTDVMVYEEVIFPCDDNSEIQSEIDAICSKVKRGYGEIIESCDDLYLGQDCYSLGVYLVSIGRNYNYFEDASGVYSKSEILFNTIKSDNRERYEMVKVLKLGGRSRFAVKVYCDLENQDASFDLTKCVDFSVRKLLKRLDEKELSRILKIYHCRRYNMHDQKKDLLLTWHYNNMGFMSLDEQREFFALLVDYFKDETESLFIKPHPSDKELDYEKWFKEAIVFERYMPSELLPFCIEGKFEKGITNWSTSVFGLQEILKEIINFDKDIDETWRDFHRYFAIAQYLNSNKKFYRQKIKLIDVNQKQIIQLVKKYVKKYKRFYKVSEKGRIYVVDKYNREYSGKKCIALTGERNNELRDVLRIEYKGKIDLVYLYNLSSNDIHTEKEMHYSGGRVIIDGCSASEYVKNMEKGGVLKSKGGLAIKKKLIE